MCRGGAELEGLLDLLAGIAADKDEHPGIRMDSADALLDFPRPRHRALLTALAEQGSFDFDIDTVAAAYAEGVADRAADPEYDAWQFYATDRFARRSWMQDDPAPRFEAPVTYVRATAKIGRNDPCSCGSGKKYKKCCLDADE